MSDTFDRNDQPDLMQSLEATQGALSEGIPLAELSARARTASAEANALIEAIRRDNEWRREHRAPAHPVEQPLTAWIRSVEARLQALSAAGSGESTVPRDGTALTRAATSAALERAGEALAAQASTFATYALDHHVDLELLQNGRVVLHDRLAAVSITVGSEALREALAEKQHAKLYCGGCDAEWDAARYAVMAGDPCPMCGWEFGPLPPSELTETCERCKQPLKVNGRLRSCVQCSKSWVADEKREPLAQSAWVPGAEEQIGPQEFRDKGKPPEQTLTERVRKLQAALDVATDALASARAMVQDRDREIDRLKITNAMQAPAERSAAAQLVVMRLGEVIELVADNRTTISGARAEAVYRKVLELTGCLERCRPLGPTRIEFSVKEVLP